MENEKTDRRKDNGGHTNGGRKPIFEDAEPVMVSFKVNKSTKKALSKIRRYGAYIENLIRKDLGLDEYVTDSYFQKDDSIEEIEPISEDENRFYYPSFFDTNSEHILEASKIANFAKNMFPERPPRYKREFTKISRNSPCSCGSGKKYKFCCIS